MSWAGPLLGSAFSTTLRSIPQFIKEMSGTPGKRKYSRSVSSVASRRKKYKKSKRSRLQKSVYVPNAAGEVTKSYKNLRSKPYLKGSSNRPLLIFKKVDSFVVSSTTGRQKYEGYAAFSYANYANMLQGLVRTKSAAIFSGGQSLFNSSSGGIESGGVFTIPGVETIIGNMIDIQESFLIDIVSGSVAISNLDLYYVIAKEDSTLTYNSSFIQNMIDGADGWRPITNQFNTYALTDMGVQAEDIVGTNVLNERYFRHRFTVHKVCSVKLAAGASHQVKFISPRNKLHTRDLFASNVAVKENTSSFWVARVHGSPLIADNLTEAVSYSVAQCGIMINTSLVCKSTPISVDKKIKGRFYTGGEALTTLPDGFTEVNLVQVDLDDTTDGKIDDFKVTTL